MSAQCGCPGAPCAAIGPRLGVCVHVGSGAQGRGGRASLGSVCRISLARALPSGGTAAALRQVPAEVTLVAGPQGDRTRP